MHPLPIDIFRCPLTAAPLVAATTAELTIFNRACAKLPPGTLGDGTVLPVEWHAAWRTAGPVDSATWYPVIDGIPVLIADAARTAP